MARRALFNRLTRGRPVDRATLIASLGVGLGVVFIVIGFMSAETGRDALKFPTEVELVSPLPGASVLRQNPVSADLVPGYTGEMAIDGVVLPPEEIKTSIGNAPRSNDNIVVPPGARFDPGTNVVSFVPGDGTPFPTFKTGRHTVVLSFWRLDEGPDRAQTYTWEFEVTA